MSITRTILFCQTFYSTKLGRLEMWTLTFFPRTKKAKRRLLQLNAMKTFLSSFYIFSFAHHNPILRLKIWILIANHCIKTKCRYIWNCCIFLWCKKSYEVSETPCQSCFLKHLAVPRKLEKLLGNICEWVHILVKLLAAGLQLY